MDTVEAVFLGILMACGIGLIVLLAMLIGILYGLVF